MNPVKKDIRNFLLVIAAGIVFAAALAWWMVRTEPLDHSRQLQDVLISPETIETISNRAVTAAPGKSARYMIERIVLSDSTPQDQWKDFQIDIGGYKKLFASLRNDEGVWENDVEGEILKAFMLTRLPSLAIYLKEEQPYQSSGKTELFQQMQFAPTTGWYRVNLHTNDQSQLKWIYFQNKHLDELLKEIEAP